MDPNNQQNPNNDSNGFYTPSNNTPPANNYAPGPQTGLQSPQEPATNNQSKVLAEWSASEFLEHNKSSGWFMALALGAIVLAVVIYFVTRQILSVVATVMLAIIIALYANTKPKTLKYVIDDTGISVDNKHYMFTEFKSFSVIESSNTPIPYLQLLPIKKLTLPLTIYVHPQNSKAISEIIGQYIPYDQKKQDIADRLSSKLRF